MPIPIRPAGDSLNFSYGGTDKGSTDNSFFMMNLDTLSGALSNGNMGRLGSMHVNAEATDADATLLLDLFNNCTIVSEAESVEDKKYAIPDDFSNSKLLRLKAASLVCGDTKVIKFTSKAARVIKTLVLSEQNAYTKSAIVKPYSVILAENKMNSAGHSTLAFSKTASDLSVFAQRINTGNREIPSEYLPNKTNYRVVAGERLIKQYGTTTDKQYIIVVFSVRDKYLVIAWNGRNRSERLTRQPKGIFDNGSEAMAIYSALISEKTREGYESDYEQGNPAQYSFRHVFEYVIAPSFPEGTADTGGTQNADTINSNGASVSSSPQPNAELDNIPEENARNGKPITPEYMPTKSNLLKIWHAAVYTYTQNGLNDKSILSILVTKTNPDKFCLVETNGVNLEDGRFSMVAIAVYSDGMSAIHKLNRIAKTKESSGYECSHTLSSGSPEVVRNIISSLPDSPDQMFSQSHAETSRPTTQIEDVPGESEESDNDLQDLLNMFDTSSFTDFKL